MAHGEQKARPVAAAGQLNYSLEPRFTCPSLGIERTKGRISPHGSTCLGTSRAAQNFVLSLYIHFTSLLLQAIASDIGLGYGLPSLHTLLISPRRLLQVAAGVLVRHRASEEGIRSAGMANGDRGLAVMQPQQPDDDGADRRHAGVESSGRRRPGRD